MSEVSKGPARGYSWEPFKPNHVKSLKHGARSERIIAPLAAILANELLETNPHLQSAEFRPAVLEWARVQAQVETLEAWIAEHGIISPDDGKIQPAAEYLLKVRKHGANMSSRLGLDPLSRARLGRDVAATQVDIAELLTKQREAAEQPHTIEHEAP
ncbi:hypothetical protein FXW78_55090 [Rhodococcus opacus]|nr:hypothetical protein [Rhodococcus opacus]